MRKLYTVLITLCILFLNVSCSHSQNKRQDAMEKNVRILIVYLTRTGNTKAVAEMIQTKMGGDLVPLEVLKPYPADYQKHVDLVAQENKKGYLPPLQSKIDISGYDMIFIGFPTWDMQVPPPVKTFLNENNWAGKIIAPFNINAGYGLGSSEKEFIDYCSQGTLTDFFSVEGGYERNRILYVMEGEKAKEVSLLLEAWLNKIRVN